MKKGSINPHLYKARVASCLFCQREFRAIKDYKDRKQKYCSSKCFAQVNRLKQKIERVGAGNPMFGKPAWNRGRFGVVKHPERSGKNCHFWKGGISREKYKLRRGANWKKWRKEIFERDKYTCKQCGKVGGRLVPHHIKLFSYFEEERFNTKNGVTLCEKCHKELHCQNRGKTIINIFDKNNESK